MEHQKNRKVPLMKELPEDERPREKLLSAGPAALSNTELLAVILGCGTRNESAVGLAARVLVSAGGLSGLGSLCVDEFRRISGIGTAKACALTAVFELGRRCAASSAAKRPKITSPQDFADLFMEEMRHLKQEQFRVILLNVKKEVIASETISVGGLCGTPAMPREVFASAVKKGAHAMIAAHNHPSGDPAPSLSDLDLTKRLAGAGALLGIELLDHIIIGDGVYCSMKEKGIL